MTFDVKKGSPISPEGALTASQNACFGDEKVAAGMQESNEALASVHDIFECLDETARSGMLGDFNGRFQQACSHFRNSLPKDHIDCELICDSDHRCHEPHTKEFQHAMGFIKLGADLAKKNGCTLSEEDWRDLSGNNSDYIRGH